MPAPDKVMMIPATFPLLVRAWIGVNENEAVVTEAFTAEVSVIARPLMPVISTNEPVAVESRTVGAPTVTSNEVPAAMVLDAS